MFKGYVSLLSRNRECDIPKEARLMAITIRILDIIHPPVFYLKLDKDRTG
jgi:hypothetical protein